MPQVADARNRVGTADCQKQSNASSPSLWERIAFWKIWRRRKAEKLLTDAMPGLHSDWVKRGLAKKFR
jgi:hypothetical protein